MAREFEAAHLRREDDYNRDVMLAYNVVRIDALTQSQKRMPALKTLLLGVASSREQTPQDHRALQLVAMKDVAERFGLRLRTKES